jgi:hypothetical protein
MYDNTTVNLVFTLLALVLMNIGFIVWRNRKRKRKHSDLYLGRGNPKRFSKKL